MDSMNDRAIREYAPGEQATNQDMRSAATEPYPADAAGSIGTIGQDMGSPDFASSATTTTTGSSTTGAKSSKRKKQADGMVQQAEQKTDAGIQMSASGLKKAADMTRSMTEEHDGAMSSIGSQAADVMEKGADYLQQGDTDRMIQDLEAMVRRRPMESLLVAAGAGFLLSKAMR